MAMLLGALVPAAVLVALFTLADPVRIAGEWPLGIRPAEVDFFASVFDLRKADTSHAEAERYLISNAEGQCALDASGPGWNGSWFEADGFGDSVEVRRARNVPGGYVVRFEREEPFRAQREIILAPADVESIRMKYLEVLAGELGLITPEVSFVRLVACGKDKGIHMKEERFDIGLLEKRGLAGASLFTQGHDATRPDHLFPEFDMDTLAGPVLRAALQHAYADEAHDRPTAWPQIMDVRTGTAILLMEWIEHGDHAFSEESICAYKWSSGRIHALYRHERSAEERSVQPALDFLTALYKDKTFKTAFEERRSQLAEDQWRIKERFAAMDRAWLPILAQGGSLARAQAVAQRIQEELIGEDRWNEEPFAMLDGKLERQAGYASFEQPANDGRYWPSADDERILQRIAERTKAEVHGDTLVFPRGRYVITEDLTIPFGHTVVLEQGARFEIGPGRSVVVQGDFHVLGTERNPVFVRPIDDAEPFGTFAVLGDGNTRCSIAGLQLSGGSEARLNGVYFSGMFAIHHPANTVLSNCRIETSHGEDLLNIKGGAVVLRDCVFADGLADLVDLDMCTGSVEHCVFRSGRNDSNGDGLDVSGARILVTGCVFEAMMDKGISVGEVSQLMVRGSRFERNRLALAAKDLSIAYVEGNTFIENSIVFGAYRKKPQHGGARVVRYPNEYIGNGKDQEVDALSAIVPQDSIDEKVWRIFLPSPPQ